MRAIAFHAMGTTIELLLPDATAAGEARLVERLFTSWESALTRFHPESELSHLNRRAGQVTLASPLLFSVLTRAMEAAKATQGIYDPTLLQQIRQAGYDRSFELLPEALPQSTEIPAPGGSWREIVLDPATRSVLLPPSAQIDLGGIAKGMAVDAALATLRRRGITSALVNAGGDLGVIGLPPKLDHWPVAVPTGVALALRRGAMATSGVTRRHWRQGDRQQHHLIDPRTGSPSRSGLLTVTVLADRCEQAEVAAKVAFILGIEQGTAFLNEHGLQGALAIEGGEFVATGGWPQKAAGE